MRTPVFTKIVLGLFFMYCSSAVFAHSVQTQSIRLVLTKPPVTIADLFNEIKAQSDYIVFYDNSLLDDNKKVSIPVGETTVETVMTEILKGTSLSYKISGKYILITQKSGKTTADNNNSLQNSLPDTTVKARKKVQGKVVGEDGEPLSNVSINVTNINRGVTSDSKGAFSLMLGRGDIVVFSHVGRETQQIVYENQSELNITLKQDSASASLGDVVVTGFQRIDKSKFAGAVAKVKIEDIKTDGVADVSRMLEGRVAGVSIQNVSGTFGAAPKVRVRGATSLSGSNKPLWVVDGVVLEDVVNVSNDELMSGDPTTLLSSSVAGINKNDIETFDILKDAAATALYGARAMNGVVVITTKKGSKSAKAKIFYDGTFSLQTKPTYDNYDIMNSADQMEMMMEILQKGSLRYAGTANMDSWGVFGKMYNQYGYDPQTGTFLVENTPQGRANFLKRYAVANTDWFDVLFRNSLTQDHTVSASFGSDKSQSYLSIGYYNDNGWTIGDKATRYTANWRNTFNISDKLTAGIITSAAVREQKSPGTLSRTVDPLEGGYSRDFDINPFSYAMNTSRMMTAYDDRGNLEYYQKNYAPFNIINELKNNTIILNVLDLKLQGELSYKITPKLRFDFMGSMRFVHTSIEHEINEKSNMAEAYRADGTGVVGGSLIRDNNRFLYRDPNDPDALPVIVLPKGGFYNTSENKLKSYNIRNMLTYDTKFGGVHSLNVMLGQEIKSAERQQSTNTGYGYQYDNGGIPFVDYRILKQYIERNFAYYSMGQGVDRFLAFFSTANYTYKNKYTLSPTVRVDGSNRLGKSRSARWLPTWTLAGTWNAMQEDFMKPYSHVISRLTFRGSYGLNADFGAANNSSVILKSTIANRPFQDEKETVIALQSLENSDLTWEKKYEGNIGFDLGLFRNRLNFSFDAYKRNSFDLITAVRTAGVGGDGMVSIANNADMTSHGFEFSINGTIVQKKDWSWKSTFTFGYNTNKITKLSELPTIGSLTRATGANQVGTPRGSLYSIKFVDLDGNTGIPLFVVGRDNKGDEVAGTYLSLQRSNSDNILRYEGPVEPTTTGGWNNSFNYKRFTLSLFFTYSFGNKVRLSPVYSNGYSDMYAMPNRFKNRWANPGDEQYTKIPALLDIYADYDLGSNNPYTLYNYSTENVADGYFIKWKTASINYNFDERLLKSIGLTTASIGFTANNIWLLYSDKRLNGQDPEYSNSGGVGSPVSKQFNLSLRVGF